MCNLQEAGPQKESFDSTLPLPSPSRLGGRHMQSLQRSPHYHPETDNQFAGSLCRCEKATVLCFWS